MEGVPVPEPQGPEPTGWELMRGLERVQQSIDSLGGKVVTQAAYDSDKRAMEERMKVMRDEIDDFHTKSSDRDRAEAAQREENTRFRKNMNLSIALAVASPIIAAVVGFLQFKGGA